MSTDTKELNALVATIKADHEAQKGKEMRDAWTKYVSLSMICLAVLAAIATQRGAGYSSATMKQLNDAVFNQAEASDQWAFYQAKGIKQSIAELERDRPAARGAPGEPQTPAGLETKADRYESEKKGIMKEAKGFEAKRDIARGLASKAADSGRELGLGTTFFQIAIALGGVCLVVKKRWLWYVSMGFGMIATVQMLEVLLVK